jgi:hypothetical protein
MTEVPAPPNGAHAVDELLELSDERDQHQRRLLDAEHRAYIDGYRKGRQDAARDLDAEWSATSPRRVTIGPTLAELELERWGPGGRRHAADPRPGDHTPSTRLEVAS